MPSMPSLPSSFHNPTSSPILIDTLILFLLQTGYYLLSRRFLLHALPTLREISKRSPDVGGHGGREDDDTGVRETGILGLPRLVVEDEDEEGGMINASGGLSDNEPSRRRRGGGRGTAMVQDRDDSDTDSIGSYTAGSPSINPSNRPSLDDYPLLPLHNHDHTHLEPSTVSIPNNLPGSALTPPTSLTTSSPSSSSSPSNAGPLGTARRTTPGGSKRKKVVLNLFHGRNRGPGRGRGKGGSAGSAVAGGKEGERLRTTRGLGWVARNLFSLCFSECLLLLTLVMFHSIDILHSRSRKIHFSFSLHVLLVLILFVVPLVQCLQLTWRSREPTYVSPTHPSTTITTTTPNQARRLSISKRFIISLIPFGIYIFMFTRIPPYITTQGSSSVVGSVGMDTGGNSTGLGLTTVESGKGSHRIVLPSHVHLWDYAELNESGRFEDGGNDEDVEVMEEEDDGEVQEDWQHGGWLEPGLGRVVVCGIIIMGALSGFGAVRTAWGFYENGGLKSGRVVSREDIIAAERSLYRVRHDIMSQRDILSRQDQLGGAGDPSAAAGGGRPSMIRSPSGWLDLFGSSSRTSSAEVDAIRRELKGLEMMEGQIKRSLEAMKLRRIRQRFAQTFRGKVYNLVGVIFAFYCIARVLMCLTSIIFPPLATSHLNQPDSPSSDTTLPRYDGKGNTNGDWISYSIALTLSQLPTGVVDVQMWSRAISLLLTGLLILASLAQVLRSVARILRLTSKSIGAGFLLLGLSQLMSTYVISLLIQMRSYIPPSTPITSDPYSSIGVSNTTEAALHPFAVAAAVSKDPSLLATLPDFRVFGRLFDVMFVLAAVGTTIWRYIGHKLNGPDEFGTVYH